MQVHLRYQSDSPKTKKIDMKRTGTVLQKGSMQQILLINIFIEVQDTFATRAMHTVDRFADL